MYLTCFVCASSSFFNNKKYNILYSIKIIYLAENVQLTLIFKIKKFFWLHFLSVHKV